MAIFVIFFLYSAHFDSNDDGRRWTTAAAPLIPATNHRWPFPPLPLLPLPLPPPTATDATNNKNLKKKPKTFADVKNGSIFYFFAVGLFLFLVPRRPNGVVKRSHQLGAPLMESESNELDNPPPKPQSKSNHRRKVHPFANFIKADTTLYNLS